MKVLSLPPSLSQGIGVWHQLLSKAIVREMVPKLFLPYPLKVDRSPSIFIGVTQTPYNVELYCSFSFMELNVDIGKDVEF